MGILTRLRSEAPEATVQQLYKAELQKLSPELKSVIVARQALLDQRDEPGDEALEKFLETGNFTVSRDEGKRLSQLTENIAGLEKILASCRSERVRAILTVYEINARACDERALAMHAEANAGELAMNADLALLREKYNCEFAPARPKRPDGPVTNAAGAMTLIVVPTPSWAMKRQAAQAIEQESRGWRARKVVMNGAVAASGEIADVIAAATSDPMRIGPTVPSIHEWALPMIAVERARRAAIHNLDSRWIDPDGPMHYELTWADGKIDPQRSHVGFLPEWEKAEVERLAEWDARNARIA